MKHRPKWRVKRIELPRKGKRWGVYSPDGYLWSDWPRWLDAIEEAIACDRLNLAQQKAGAHAVHA